MQIYNMPNRENFQYFPLVEKKDVSDIYFKMHCLYNAKTELFDRSLTDVRDKYDSTSAYIGVSARVRNASNQYARMLYENCKRRIKTETKKPFSRELWLRSVDSYGNLSAQGWVDLYEQMIANGEFKEIEVNK